MIISQLIIACERNSVLGFFLVIKVFLLFIFLKIYASVNMPEICSSFTTCISMLGFLTH